MAPNQALVLWAVAMSSLGFADRAISVLIDEGVLEADQHIQSDSYRQALLDAEVDIEEAQ